MLYFNQIYYIIFHYNLSLTKTNFIILSSSIHYHRYGLATEGSLVTSLCIYTLPYEKDGEVTRELSAVCLFDMMRKYHSVLRLN